MGLPTCQHVLPILLRSSSSSFHRPQGGWQQKGVKSSYHFFSAKGDHLLGRMLSGHLLGRMVSGLLRKHKEFMYLPPHFSENAPSTQILYFIYVVFGRLPDSFLVVAKHALASLAYHANWLRGNIPGNHMLFSTTLFRNLDLLQSIERLVKCGIPDENYHIQASMKFFKFQRRWKKCWTEGQ